MNTRQLRDHARRGHRIATALLYLIGVIDLLAFAVMDLTTEPSDRRLAIGGLILSVLAVPYTLIARRRFRDWTAQHEAELAVEMAAEQALDVAPGIHQP